MLTCAMLIKSGGCRGAHPQINPGPRNAAGSVGQSGDALDEQLVAWIGSVEPSLNNPLVSLHHVLASGRPWGLRSILVMAMGALNVSREAAKTSRRPRGYTHISICWYCLYFWQADQSVLPLLLCRFVRL